VIVDQRQPEAVVSFASGFASEAPDGAARAAGTSGADSATSSTALARALAISRQRVKAAELVIDGLREQEAALRRKVDQLAQTIESARQHAFHDPLTGLPNRSLLFDRFNQAVAQGKRRDRRVALLFLDLDGFKVINDTLGHTAGDCILQQVAARLTACVRAADTVCRYGGDEFVVLLPESGGEKSATVAADKIRAQLAAPYAIDGTTVGVSASIGMAIYPIDALDYTDLLQLSDRAMYRNKAGTHAGLHAVAR
jgi:diguanylate cyclase